MPDVKTFDGIPIDKALVFADLRAIAAYSPKIADQVKNVPREFMVSMDESGFADSVDERVVVSKDYPHPSIPVPVDRRTALKPLIILARVIVEKELFL
jgi:hypothetical protein